MPTLRLDGDARGAIKANLDMAKAIEKASQEADKAEKRLTKMERAAKRIQEANDPQKRYNRQIQETAKLAATGAISIEDAKRASERYAKSLARAGQTGRSAFGEIAGQVRSTILGLAGVQQALGAIVAGFREVRAEQERAQQAALSSRAGVGELSQLAATTANPQATFAGLVSEARAARASGAADSQQEAANLLFGLVSAGLNKPDRDFAFKLRRQGTLQNIGGAATAFSALTSAVGAGEVGSFEDFISKSLRASSIAPALANQIPQAATRAGGSAQALGISDEFLLAATAVLGRTTGTAEQGGTQLAAFLKQVEKAGPKLAGASGKSGVELVEFIAGLSEADQGFGGVLGDRAEAVQGFRTLKANIDLLRTLTRDVDAADDNGLARAALRLPGTDQQQRAAIARASAEGRAEVSRGTDAALQNLLDAALAERRRTALLQSDGFLTRANLGIEAAQIGVERLIGITPGFTRGVLRELVSEGAIQDKELLREINATLAEQNSILSGIRDQKPVTTRAE